MKGHLMDVDGGKASMLNPFPLLDLADQQDVRGVHAACGARCVGARLWVIPPTYKPLTSHQ